MRTNTKLQKAVLAELEWDPRLDASNVGVATVDGIVTLTGQVKTYPERVSAEEAVKRVSGAKGVANDIKVSLPGSLQLSDTQLAQDAIQALERDVMVPHDRVTVRVSEGWLTLEGELEWEYQRNAAERAVHNLRGLRGCINDIALKPKVTASQVKERIEQALRRRVELDTRQLTVLVEGNKVTLKGAVHTWREHDDAVSAAWDTTGVSAVRDELTIAV